MPPFDENGNMIDLNDFPIALRGDDAVEYIYPGSIPEAHFTDDSDEEHDCLPPFDTTKAWALTAKFAKKLTEAIEKLSESAKDTTVIVQSLTDVAHEMLEGKISTTPAVIDNTRRTREWRRAIRWNEKNRRRMLKGLPWKRNPYPRVFAFTCMVNLVPKGPIDLQIVTEDEHHDAE